MTTPIREYPKIICEIPPSSSPTAWVADSEDDIISAAYEHRDMIYERWTLSQAIECWGEKEDLPQELAELFEQGHDVVIESGDHNDTFFDNPNDAWPEIEIAVELIKHDLNSCHFLTVDEAKEFILSYGGHQDIKARVEVKEVLDDLTGESHPLYHDEEE